MFELEALSCVTMYYSQGGVVRMWCLTRSLMQWQGGLAGLLDAASVQRMKTAFTEGRMDESMVNVAEGRILFHVSAN